ncbi:MAG: hypothetical protein GY757_26025 [bacterium]|nr:hypothetical protein [bacterium]
MEEIKKKDWNQFDFQWFYENECNRKQLMYEPGKGYFDARKKYRQRSDGKRSFSEEYREKLKKKLKKWHLQSATSYFQADTLYFQSKKSYFQIKALLFP